MKSIVGYVLFAVLAYCTFLLVGFPADRAYAMFRHNMPPGVQLYDLHGSVWHGEAGTARIGRYRLEPLHWQYRPAGLLSGRVDVQVSFKTGPSHVSAVIGIYRDGDVHLRDVDIGTPAGELIEAFRVPIVRLDGQVSAKLTRMGVENHRLESLDGTVTWAGARITRPQTLTLGGLEATFKTEGGVIKGILKDKGGPLQVQGTVTLKPDGSYQVRAVLESRDPNQPALANALRRLGRAGPGGRVTVNYSGKMPPIPVGL